MLNYNNLTVVTMDMNSNYSNEREYRHQTVTPLSGEKSLI